MSFRTKVSLAIALVLLVIGGIWTSAQARQTPGMFGDGLDLVAPTVIAGNDLGFRIESTRNNIAVGTLVVRIDGHWVEAQVGSGGVITTSAR